MNTHNKNKVVLFDMDGTLTPARKKIAYSTIQLLELVSTQAKIGIVSGSPLPYIKQQLSQVWDSNLISKNSITLMPCNGTQVYSYNSFNNCFEEKYHVDFMENLVEVFGSKKAAIEKYNSLVTDVLELQLGFLNDNPELSVSGNFVSYRQSLINWSMIGRDATNEQRAAFSMFDSDTNLRDKLRESLRVRLDTSGLREIECVTGGATSIDIYPRGWDKTHALRHFEDHDVWFWGDRCSPGGNDFALYEALGPGKRSFAVEGPNDLEDSLRNNLDIDWEEADLIVGNKENKNTTGSD